MAEFYEQRQAELGDPAADPVMTVRVHPDDDPASTDARRAIRTVRAARPWVRVTSPDPGSFLPMRDDEVRAWPVTHPIVYCAAYRHASLAAEREQAGSPERGDMGVESFKG